MNRKRIGEILAQRGVLKRAEVEAAAAAASAAGMRLVSHLAARGVDEGLLVEALSAQHGFPGIDLSASVLQLSQLLVVPPEIAIQERLLPLRADGAKLLVAVADPFDRRVIDEVELVTGMQVLPHVALSTTLEIVISAAYDALARGETLWRGPTSPAGATRDVLALRVARDTSGDADDVEIEVDGDDLGFDEEENLATVSARPGPRIVLCVDDEEEILTLLAKALGQKGYRVEKARRGQEALDRVSELFPDLILLDANLPEVHGFEVCRKVKSNPRFSRIPIIMMTAVYRGWRFAQDSREVFGVDDYIEKPFHLEDLLRRVEHHLTKSIGEPPRDRERADRMYDAGTKLLDAGKPKEAIAALEDATTADPFSPRIQYQLGRALQASGEAYRAIGAYERSVELRPDHFPTLRSLAALYQQKGFRRKAIETWERAIPAAPDDQTREKIKSSLLSLL